MRGPLSADAEGKKVDVSFNCDVIGVVVRGEEWFELFLGLKSKCDKMCRKRNTRMEKLNFSRGASSGDSCTEKCVNTRVPARYTIYLLAHLNI